MSLAFLAQMGWKSAIIAGAALVILSLLRSRPAADRAPPTIPQLLAAGAHRVTAAYLQSLDGVGYRAGSIDKLVALRIFNIDAQRIAALGAVSPVAPQKGKKSGMATIAAIQVIRFSGRPTRRKSV